jgi:xylitol oxidase
VSALELVVADGSITSLSRDKDPDVFSGSVLSLGALGIVTRLTIDLVPRFLVKQEVYEGLERATLESHFDEIMSSAYSVSLFWDWRSATINQVWRKEVVEADATEELPSTFFGATLATGPRHPIPGISPEPCTEQMGVPGPWYERLPHFKLAFTPSSGEELQTEYFVARQDACEALSALNSLADRIAALVQITEIRTVAADDLWLSPCYLRDGVGIHFTWKKEWDSVNALLPHIEAALMPFEPRPHWGKLFTMGEDRLTSLYGRAAQFRQLLKAHDPNRKFENAFLDRCGFYN